jgi:hypothetical protein
MMFLKMSLVSSGLFLGVVLGRMVGSSEFDATRPAGVWSDCSISAGSRLGVHSAELRFALDASDFVRSGRRFGVLASLVAFDVEVAIGRRSPFSLSGLISMASPSQREPELASDCSRL